VNCSEKEKNYMTIHKIMLIILLCILALPIISCTTDLHTDEFPIDRDVAIMIASAAMSSSTIGEAYVVTLWNDSNWTVYFVLVEHITKNELGWPESPNTKFEHQGMLPEDTYRLLAFTIDRRTGAVLSRKASDSFLLGGPGMFNTEPPERIFLPLWSAIASGIGGLVIGGMVVWLIMHRKRINE
jgi:hypothetical protein